MGSRKCKEQRIRDGFQGIDEVLFKSLILGKDLWVINVHEYGDAKIRGD